MYTIFRIFDTSPLYQIHTTSLPYVRIRSNPPHCCPWNWGWFQPPEYDLGLEWFQFWIRPFCERACKALHAHNPFRHYLWDRVGELFNIIGNYWKLAHQRPDKHGQIIYYGNQLNFEVRFQPPSPARPKGHRPLVPFEVGSRNGASSSAGIAWGGGAACPFY